MMMTSRSVAGLFFVVVVLSLVLAHGSVSHEKRRQGCGPEVADGLKSRDGKSLHTEAMCCETKNNSCVAHGPRLNSPTATTCFCDADCMTNGDCCLDYAEQCPAINCVVDEEWSEWTACDVRCGQGLKRRHRKVKVEPRNGGHACHTNDTVQTLRCMGTSCKVQRSSDRSLEIDETGRIIPAAFASWRHDKLYSPFQDIRKNLFDHYGDPSAVNRPPYAAEYELTYVHSTCRKMSKRSNAWLTKLVKGARLCVECQSIAMQRELGARCQGHGVFEKSTQWRAVTVPGCHGKWRLATHHSDQISCDPKDGLSFSFV